MSKNTKATTAGKRTAQKPLPTAPPPPVAPMFRPSDWLGCLVTFLVTWAVYFLTLAPEVTLEDAGELITGSMYAGIPHPPGYPVWTLYSWLWTVLVPVGNMAWRVALAQANAGAVACALIALIVSRGSSLLIESIESLKDLAAGKERAICMVAGVVAGLLLGLDAFMWRESVAANRMAVASVPWFMLVLVCLLRWVYARHQFRFLYWALFLFGLCFTTHQSLIVAAIGIEALIAAANPRLGRDVFLGNSIIYLIYNVALWSTGQHLFHNLGAKPGLLLIFNVIGIGSLVACGWLAVRTKKLLTEWKPVVMMGLLWLLGASFYFYLPVSGMTNPPMQWCYPRTVDGFFHALTRGQYEQPNPINVLHEPGRFLGQLEMLLGGVGDSFTWVMVLLALVPFLFWLKMRPRERAWLIGLAALYLCLGVLLMILLNPTPERGSADLVKVFFNNSHTIVAALIGYGLALTAATMATHYERFRRWGMLGGIMAMLLALYSLADSTARHYFGPAGQLGLAELPRWIGRAFSPNQYGLPIFANLLLAALALVFLCAMVLHRHRAPLALALAIFVATPLYSGLSHWFECDQRGHMFGYWFGHDMFLPPFNGADGKPLFPAMTKDAVVFGGTDPGRFCPTYMVFCESFTPHRCQPIEDQTFDRRDVYVITQNALADPPYLNYIRAHYHRSAQIDPPFFSELARTVLKDKEYETNLLARAAAPLDAVFTGLGERIEKRRRASTSWFAEKDFVDLPAFAGKLRPGGEQDPLSKYLYENLSARTQELVCAKPDEKPLRRCLARDLNALLEREVARKKRLATLQLEKEARDTKIARGGPSASLLLKREALEKEIAELSDSLADEAASEQTVQPADKGSPRPRVSCRLYRPERFRHVALSSYLTDFIGQNPQSHSRIRLNRLLLEAAYPKDIAKSDGGLYPDREIYTPSIEDHQQAFQEYIQDVERRMKINQLRPGEDVKVIDNRIQVGGTVAVMAINGLLTKLIFDRNPDRDFFVEESFPLEWMYPHLTPHGVIMKINRQPVSSMTDDLLQRDHEFWKQYCRRLTGDIIDYGSPVKEVTGWIEKTYLRYDFNQFTGERKFVHDIDAQKSFSKLRTAIAGVYAWRLGPQCPPEYRPKTNAEFQSLAREANFAFLQAFAFSPWSPEAVIRYVNFLIQFNRLDDALLVAETCLEFDPYDTQVLGLANNLRQYKKQFSILVPPR
jgi:hypothetical protein